MMKNKKTNIYLIIIKLFLVEVITQEMYNLIHWVIQQIKIKYNLINMTYLTIQ